LGCKRVLPLLGARFVGHDEDLALALHGTPARLPRWGPGRSSRRRASPSHGLFFAHLALEKVLKAHVCRHTGELAPYIHDLVRLASAASLPLDDHRRDVLAKMNAYALAGRYPDTLPATVTPTDARARLAEAREVFEWLMTQLPG
jgi:HEPN domain-containing protein